MTQGRIRLPTIFLWLALVAHCVLAAVLLVLTIGLSDSDVPKAIVMAIVFGIVVLPVVPSIWRVFAEQSLWAAIKPSRSGPWEWMVVALAAFGLPLLLFGWPDLVAPAWYQAGDDQKMDQLTGISLIWLANVVRELTS
jgi:hypothetical protein